MIHLDVLSARRVAAQLVKNINDLEDDLIILLLGLEKLYEGGKDVRLAEIDGGTLVGGARPNEHHYLQDEVILPGVRKEPGLHPGDHLKLSQQPERFFNLNF